MVLFTIVACKKNEENFAINEDLLTPIVSNNVDPTIPDLESSWIGNYLLVRTSNEIIATGEKTNVTEHTSKIANKYMSFAKQNMKHNFNTATDRIEDWAAINNDEIKIESDAFFFDASPTYFDVEITESVYSGYESFLSIIGPEAAASVDANTQFLLSVFPDGKIERLRLTMDYSFLSTDQSQRSREFREYHFYRIMPSGPAFTFTTRDKYVQ